jgi:precorrin-4/cobalt-precorrin-4 C11-methyltransferase
MIYIVSIGPGFRTDYLTLEAFRMITNADIAIYVGEMIGEEIKNIVKGELIVSRKLTIDDVKKIINDNIGKNIVLMEPGDVSLYSGQIDKQYSMTQYLSWFRKKGFSFKIIPGISSWSAVCASLGIENTKFNSSQTIVITSIERLIETKAFNEIEISKLLEQQPNLVLFQSFREWDKIYPLLLKAYPKDTPIIFAYKLSWEDEVIIRGKLSESQKLISHKNINKHTLILIGETYETVDGQ